MWEPKNGAQITWSKCGSEKGNGEEEMCFEDIAVVKLIGLGSYFATEDHGKE